MHDDQVAARSPCLMRSETPPVSLVGKVEDVALGDVLVAPQTWVGVNSSAAQTVTSMAGCHDEVALVAAAPVVPAGHGPDERSAGRLRDLAQAGIALQEHADGFATI